MASFKFSTRSEISFDQSYDHSLIFKSTYIYAPDPNWCKFRLPHDKRRIGAWKIVTCGGFHVDCGSSELSKSFVLRKPFPYPTDYIRIVIRPSIYPFHGRPNYTQINGLEGSGVTRYASKLVDKIDEGARSLQEESSDGEDLILKKPKSDLEDNMDASLLNNVGLGSGRKLGNQSPGAKKATIGRRASKPGSRRNGQSSFHKRYDRNSVPNVDDKLDAAIASIGPSSSSEECNFVLVQLERSSDEKTLSFFQWMKDKGKLKGNVNAYNLALRVLARKEDWYSAQALLHVMTSDSSCKLTFQVFNTLIYICSKRGLADWGTKWFHLMLDSGVEPNVATIGMLMKLYQKSTNLAEAEFTFGYMRSCKLYCTSAYSSMITMYTHLGLYDKSEGIISIMEEDNVLPNLENWLVRLNAYSQQGKLREAESVLKLMQEIGISPNIIAYNTLITGYGKVGNVNAARLLFQDLQNIGLEPDETTYRSMVEGFGRANDYKEALWYYKELKRSGFHPNSSNLYTMVNLQARHKDEEGAIQTLKDMRVMGCQYSSMVGSLLQAYERVGRVDKVPLVLKASFYEKVLLDQTSCSILVTAYVENCLLEDALQVMREKKWADPNFEDNLYHLMICTCKEAGFPEYSVKIFTKMPKSDTKPNLHVTCSMIDIFSTMNRFGDAEDLYLKLKNSATTLDMVAYSIIVRMYVKAGSLKDAVLVLDMMEKQKDIIPDKFLFFDMLRIYQQCGMLEKLTEVYYKILKSGITLDEEMYNCVINCCSHALPIDELSRLFGEMLRRGMRTSTTTFNVMLDAYGKAKLFKKVRKVLWIARNWGLADAITFNTVIAAYGQTKDFKNMRSAFLHMQFAQFPVTLEAYNSMLDAYGKGDQLMKFRDILRRMRSANCDSDHYTYNIMINTFGRKGWIAEVKSVLDKLKACGLKPDLVSYNTLIQAYGNVGMVEEAVNVVKEMRENGIEPDRRTYTNLVAALQKNDNFLEAVKWSLWMKQKELLSLKC